MLPQDVGKERQPPPDQLTPLLLCEAVQGPMEDEAAGVHGQGGQEGAPCPVSTYPQHGQVDQGLAEVEDLTDVSLALNTIRDNELC